jgi:hypothetical protein
MMKADKNVFPYELQNSYGSATVYKGLNVRDYIAIQAMTGFSANSEYNDRSFEDVADMAYKQADAMIERSKVK